MSSRALRRRSSYRAINGHRRRTSRPFLRVLLVCFVLFLMLTSGASAATLLFYGDSLPTVKDFTNHFQFQNTRILDRNGHALFNLADLSKSRGRRVVKPLIYPGHTTAWYRQHGDTWLVGQGSGGIPVALQNATIATEDATFYSNPGFDPLSIARAAYDDLTKGHVVSGASTITQQLIKTYLLGASSAAPTLSRKAEEIILATELTQKYPKTEILWYYLNSVPYGNEAIGAQAAARTYFQKNVWDLDQAQAAFLAGLPEAPGIYDPVSNLPAALSRMHTVLDLMYKHGYLVDANGKRDPSLIAKYMAEAQKWPKFHAPGGHATYPQFVQYVIQQLQKIPELNGKLYNGLDVYTTIDRRLQNAAQQTVTDQINSIENTYNVTDGALVSIDLQRGPHGCYGCIRAMVGSADYNAPGGQINMANSPRQPGSSFKPFNYIWAFEHGLGPATTVVDGPIAIPDTGNAADGGVYAPTDYDQTWHGVVTLREALDNSLNVPAVKVEQYDAQVGGSVYNTVRAEAIKQGITSFDQDNPNCCGWALTLGGMEHGVRLVEETGAYGAFATNGHLVTPIAIRKVIDRTTGKVLYDASTTMHAAYRDQVIPPADAYIMNNVLSDDNSRCTPVVCEFGLHSDLYLGRPAGAKTGTTNAFTDNWTVGYTPDLVTGVWVGNANNQPMYNSTGITGAAPIWHDFMLKAFDILHTPPDNFTQPSGVYYGSTCQQPTGYGGSVLSSSSYDVYAQAPPLCSVGTYSQLPLPSQPSTQGAPTPVPQVPVATSPPVVPTSTPIPAPTPQTQQLQPTQQVVSTPAPISTPIPASTPVPVATSPPVAPTPPPVTQPTTVP